METVVLSLDQLFYQLLQAWRKSQPHLPGPVVNRLASAYWQTIIQKNAPGKRHLAIQEKIRELREGQGINLPKRQATLNQLWYGNKNKGDNGNVPQTKQNFRKRKPTTTTDSSSTPPIVITIEDEDAVELNVETIVREPLVVLEVVWLENIKEKNPMEGSSKNEGATIGALRQIDVDPVGIQNGQSATELEASVKTEVKSDTNNNCDIVNDIALELKRNDEKPTNEFEHCSFDIRIRSLSSLMEPCELL